MSEHTINRPPEVGYLYDHEIRNFIPDDDPFKEDKKRANRMIKKMLPEVDKRVDIINIEFFKLNEVLWIVQKARDILMKQDMLLELQAPVNICGDIHGQYYDLLQMFDKGGYPLSSNYLFLGDYVDRGNKSIECICLLLLYKILLPNNIFLLRGNHETSSVNMQYGFYDECKRRFNIKLWKSFADCFNCMPLAAVVDDRIFCVHGGLSEKLVKGKLNKIKEIRRPMDDPADDTLEADLLWSDPDANVTGKE